MEKELPSWVKYIHNRIQKNKNFLCFISGPTGSGKSWAGLSICKMVDPTFNKSRIVTSMQGLMDLINSGDVDTGSAILWDEASVDINAKSWQSLTNKLVNSLLTTFRHKRFIVIFTSPYLDFIDASTRKLFHAEFIMKNIDYKEGFSRVKPSLIQYNPRNKKFYYKYLRIRRDKKLTKISLWKIPQPPQELINDYEKIKTNFTKQLNLDISRQLNNLKSKQEDSKDLTDMQRKVLDMMAEIGNVEMVSKELGVSKNTLYFHIKAAKKKGFDIKNYENEEL
jgi:ABC-type dipeptide/oligopeptide/nickel transport system ATPase component